MSDNHPKKTKEQEEAEAQLNDLISMTAPKGFVSGVTSGVNNILAGAVGAVGVVILAPTVGLVAGTQAAGIFGGLFGFVGGAVVGALGAVVLGVGGTCFVCELCDIGVECKTKTHVGEMQSHD